MSLPEMFCDVDDFCRQFETWAQKQQLPGKPKRGPAASLCPSEIMTIVIYFHQQGYRDFKSFYQKHVQKYLQDEFPGLVSYNRFVELMPSVLLPLCAYLQSRLSCTGIGFVDSTPTAVCHNRRIRRHKVFKDLAAHGKTTMAWFYGFKLHLIVNEQGELLAVHLTPGNVDDRKPLPKMTQNLFGKLFGDKGYLSQALFEKLLEQGLELITSLRKNMKGQLMLLSDKLLLRKRFIIETINDQLKNISQIEHTRHRSPTNFAVNLVAGLIAYTHQPKNLLFVCHRG